MEYTEILELTEYTVTKYKTINAKFSVTRDYGNGILIPDGKPKRAAYNPRMEIESLPQAIQDVASATWTEEAKATYEAFAREHGETPNIPN